MGTVKPLLRFQYFVMMFVPVGSHGYFLCILRVRSFKWRPTDRSRFGICKRIVSGILWRHIIALMMFPAEPNNDVVPQSNSPPSSRVFDKCRAYENDCFFCSFITNHQVLRKSKFGTLDSAFISIRGLDLRGAIGPFLFSLTFLRVHPFHKKEN